MTGLTLAEEFSLFWLLGFALFGLGVGTVAVAKGTMVSVAPEGVAREAVAAERDAESDAERALEVPTGKL